jgi:hypothetical protein
MRLAIFKPLGRKTAVVEIWDEDRLLAEVFASDDGTERLHLSEDAARDGIHWAQLESLVPKISENLRQANEEMREARASLGEAE